MLARLIAALCGWSAALCLGCGGDDAQDARCEVQPAQSALFGASPDGGRANADAVVALLAQVSRDRAELCSGALIAPRLVLTAGHCLPSGSSAEVFFGASIRDPDDVRLVTEVFADDDRDLALAVLEASGRGEPEPLALALDEDIRTGELGTLAGFGLDERGEFGARLFVAEAIADFDRELVLVDGKGKTGACTGDSGGPLLVERDGELRVLGVLSVGSASCSELDLYQRVAPVARWLERVMEQTAPRRSATGC